MPRWNASVSSSTGCSNSSSRTCPSPTRSENSSRRSSQPALCDERLAIIVPRAAPARPYRQRSDRHPEPPIRWRFLRRNPCTSRRSAASSYPALQEGIRALLLGNERFQIASTAESLHAVRPGQMQHCSERSMSLKTASERTVRANRKPIRIETRSAATVRARGIPARHLRIGVEAAGRRTAHE